tara:strand:- start:185 stop:1141 length:957 start_codon:yes stop_codon:yes gene_type:complete
MSGTLVLGGTGFLGAHVAAVAHRLAFPLATMAEPQGPPVYAIGRDPDDAPRFCDPREGIVWIKADLLTEGRFQRLTETCDPDFVINAAALSSVAACEADPELAKRMNTDLAREVAKTCAANNLRLVHVSTDQVFGETAPPESGFTEDAPTAPVSVYGRTKADGERAVLEEDPAALVVRLPLLYGNSGGRGRGASDALLEGLHREERPTLFVDEWRTPLEVSTAAEALVELAQELPEVSGLLHVAGPDRISRFDLAVAILRAMGLDADAARAELDAASCTEYDGPAPRAADVALDAMRARKVLETALLGIGDGAKRAMT